MQVRSTPDAVVFEQRLRELSELTVRVGYQRGEYAYDPDEVATHHEAMRKKRKKGKGSSADTAEVVHTVLPPNDRGAVHKPGASKHAGNVDMLDVVMWNELGTVHSPSRPFLRMSVDENKESIVKFVTNQFKKFAQLKIDVAQLLGLLGNFQVRLIQEKIRNGSFVPNAPRTIAIKGSDKPLIDTGRMRQSVHFQVMKKEDAVALDTETI